MKYLILVAYIIPIQEKEINKLIIRGKKSSIMTNKDSFSSLKTLILCLLLMKHLMLFWETSMEEMRNKKMQLSSTMKDFKSSNFYSLHKLLFQRSILLNIEKNLEQNWQEILSIVSPISNLLDLKFGT